MAADLRADVCTSVPIASRRTSVTPSTSAGPRALAQDGHGVELPADDPVVAAEHAVVATPPALAARIAFEPSLPPAHQHLLLRMAPGAAIRLITTYREPF